MSVADWARAANRARRHGDRLVAPRRWALWQVPRPFLVLVLAVDAAAVAIIVGTAPLYAATGRHVVWFAVLAGLSVVHLEMTRRVERRRELLAEGVPYVSSKSIWTFAGLLTLPPSLVAALIVLTYAHSWVRMGRTILPHRSIFSASTVVLASAAGGAILATSGEYPALPVGPWGIGAVVAAALARWAVNSALVFVAMPLMGIATWARAWRAVFGTPADDLIEFTTMSYGAVLAALLTMLPSYAWFLALPVLMLHRGIRFEQTAETDRETGALRWDKWRELVVNQLDRAQRLGTTAGYLFVRLDAVPAGLADVAEDRIGRRVADAIRSAVRDSDLIGRLPGGYDFAVLVVDIPPGNDLRKVAERIRLTIKNITITVDRPAGATAVNGLTASIGGASYPIPAQSLPELMTSADNALFLARTFVRDTVQIVEPDADTPAAST